MIRGGITPAFCATSSHIRAIISAWLALALIWGLMSIASSAAMQSGSSAGTETERK